MPEALVISVINLDRRPDRWESFQATMRAAAGPEFAERCKRVAAVDGREVRDTPGMRFLFRGNDFGFRSGVVGCALSHISLWHDLAEQGGNERLALVLEDDAQPLDRFDRRLAAMLDELRDVEEGFDLVLLGYTPIDAHEPKAKPVAPRLLPMRWQRYLGGSFAYLLSVSAARKLVELAQRDGVQGPIDKFLMAKAAESELRVLECEPSLVVSLLAWPGNGADSDVQHDLAPIGDPRAGR